MIAVIMHALRSSDAKARFIVAVAVDFMPFRDGLLMLGAPDVVRITLVFGFNPV